MILHAWRRLPQAIRSKPACSRKPTAALCSPQLRRQRRRLIAENHDFTCLAPFASGYPFEACVFPKAHSSAFSRINAVQIENLARILRDVLQRLDHTLGGPPYNLSLPDRTFPSPTQGLLEDDRRRLSLASGNPPATHWTDRLRAGLLVLLQPGAPRNCRKMPLRLTKRKSRIASWSRQSSLPSGRDLTWTEANPPRCDAKT